jgi:coenzyme Q-binding protein COQ10
MREFQNQQRVECPAELMFVVVSDIARYPEFVPGWRSVRVQFLNQRQMAVEQTVGLGPVEWRFASRAEVDTPWGLKVVSSEAPFRRLEVDWRFSARGEDACLVTLRVVAELASTPARHILAGLLPTFSRGLIPVFAERAQALADTGPDRG